MRQTAMVIRIQETADISKNSVVRELKIEEVAPQYDIQLTPITEDVLRFDIPTDYGFRLGTLFDEQLIHVVKKDDSLLISCLPLGEDPLQSIRLKSFLYKPYGFPRSKLIDPTDGGSFCCIPKDLADNFKAGDKIVYTFHDQTEDYERHLVVTHV
jgi:hypothetical protein